MGRWASFDVAALEANPSVAASRASVDFAQAVSDMIARREEEKRD